MGFFNKLQRALGFSYEDEQLDNYDNLLPAVVPSGTINGDQQYDDTARRIDANDGGGAAPDVITEEDPDINRIFEGVIEFINKDLPPYLKQCVDTDAQREYLFNNLESSVKGYLLALANNERIRAQKSRESERDKTKRQLEEAREKLKLAQENLTQENEKAMSLERQKRALNSRIKDLEAQVASLLAEREQLDLESRSLQNKLRVAEVKASWADSEPIEIAQKNEELTKEIETLNEKIEQLTAEALQNTSLKEALQNQLNSKIEELNGAETHLADKDNEIALIRREKDEKENVISLLQKNLEERQTEIEQLKNETAELKQLLEVSVQKEMPAPPKPETVSAEPDPVPYTPSYQFVSFEEEKPIEAPKKKRSRTKKTEFTVKDDILTDTDWLIEAAKEADNPDRIVTPDQNRNNTDNNGPSQLSLW